MAKGKVHQGRRPCKDVPPSSQQRRCATHGLQRWRRRFPTSRRSCSRRTDLSKNEDHRLPGVSQLRSHGQRCRQSLSFQRRPSDFNFQVFSLYDIKNVYMDGHCTYNARMKILTTFDDDPSVRVMIFSSVGACGLNLSKASTLIFLVTSLYSTQAPF